MKAMPTEQQKQIMKELFERGRFKKPDQANKERVNALLESVQKEIEERRKGGEAEREARRRITPEQWHLLDFYALRRFIHN